MKIGGWCSPPLATVAATVAISVADLGDRPVGGDGMTVEDRLAFRRDDLGDEDRGMVLAAVGDRRGHGGHLGGRSRGSTGRRRRYDRRRPSGLPTRRSWR